MDTWRSDKSDDSISLAHVVVPAAFVCLRSDDSIEMQHAPDQCIVGEVSA
jgi:hypothetical protein